MLIDIGLMFEEMVGHELINLTEVEAVVSDKVKCTDGTLLEFYDEVDDYIYEGDEVLVLRRRWDPVEIESLREYSMSRGNMELVARLDEQLQVAQCEGFYIAFAAIINDEFHHLYRIRA